MTPRPLPEILTYPSPRELAAFAAAAPHRQLSGVAAEGQVHVFRAWDATHMQVRTAFGLPTIYETGTDFWVVPEDDEPISGDWQSGDEDLVRDGLRLIQGARKDDPALERLVSWFSGRRTRHAPS